MPSRSTAPAFRSHPAITALAITGAGALAWNAARLTLELLGPTIPYRLAKPIDEPLDSEDFINFLGVITDASVHRDTAVEILRNGTQFYPAELSAIRSAGRSIQMQFFEFFRGELPDTMMAALVERARNGVEVNIVVDAFGSFGTPDRYFDELRSAGGKMFWYHPMRFRNVPFLDRRTHRKLLVVDNQVGFIGGAGIADHWIHKSTKGALPWRDTMFRIEGGAVSSMVSVLSEDWLETSGEILTTPLGAVHHHEHRGTVSLVVGSTPQEGAARARILYQVLINSARKSIWITNPYFLPDRSARLAILRAIRERNVKVCILTNGAHSDHPGIMKFSRSLEIELLRAGAEVYEYRPGMLHAKLMMIDEQWSVLGSANFDHRSFALNNEVNMAVLDRGLARELCSQMEEDIWQSDAMTVHRLRKRSVATKVMDDLTWLVRREE